MNKQEKSAWMKSAATESILECIGASKTKQTRKTILDNAVKVFRQKCTAHKVAVKKGNDAKSYIGTVLNELISEKTLTCENGFVAKSADDGIIVDKTKCKAKLLELLKKKEYEKAELYRLIIESLGAHQTATKADDNEIKGYIGQLLTQYVNDGTLEICNKKYRIRNKTGQKRSTQPIGEAEFKKEFLSRLHENGGRFFERFFANVLEKYFTVTGRTVWDCVVCGGSDDGGIDIRIKLTDDLGFVDEVMVQTKCRDTAQVTENEIRNFYGAINAVKASKGIFVTTSTFHSAADKLLHQLDNCVGIDGDGVFELSKKVLYGMKILRGGYVFDEMVFDI